MKLNNRESKLIIFVVILVILLIILGIVLVYLLLNPRTVYIKEQATTTQFNNSNIEEYTDDDKKQIKDTIEKYYNFLGAKENAPSVALSEILGLTVYSVQDPKYAPSNYVEHPNSNQYAWTGISYESFRNKLWYLSDSVLANNFSEFVKYKDYLYIDDDPEYNKGIKYDILEEKIEEDSTKDICIVTVTAKEIKTNKIITNRITMKRGNGDFVITEITGDSTNNTKLQNEIESYKGVWQYYENSNTEIPEKELIINEVNDNTINFDFIIYRITSFENISGNLSGNIATFDANNENGWNLKGTIVFADNNVIIDIKQSSSDLINNEKITFITKTTKSKLK